MSDAVLSETTLETRGQVPWLKIAAAILLIGLAEWWFFEHGPGSSIGAFALIWAAASFAVAPGLFRNRPGLIAAGLATAFALVLLDRPGLPAAVLFFFSLTFAALLPRAGQAFDDFWRWGQRLFLHGLNSLVGPLLDAIQISRDLPRGQERRLLSILPIVLVPMVGGVVFLALFAIANPVIEDLFRRIDLRLDDVVPRTIFAGVVLVLTWGTLSPKLHPPFLQAIKAGENGVLGVPVAAVVLSLIVFNALFAMQNGLDVAFLWNGAKLPAGITLADYAHRGAYALIVTALLAGGFVLATLRPGSASARLPIVRFMLLLWIAQTIFLLASSALRMGDYIEAYSLTRLRIAALAWMALVAIGLALICWRILRDKSAAWLINANAFSAIVVLAASSVVDYGAIAAAWNVRHAGELTGNGAALDLCYLGQLGQSATVSLVELERGPLPAGLKDRVAWVRQGSLARLEKAQADPYTWTLRGARRLNKAQSLAQGLPSRPAGAPARRCNGELVPPPPVPASPPQTSAPLTNPSQG